MKTKLWIAIMAVTCVLGYFLGFTISTATGVEPGFFEIAESGGYGVAAESNAAEGISDNLQDYYSNLSEEQ